MKLLKQFGIIMGVYVGCEIIMLFVPINFPASVLGMLVMFTLLCIKVIKLEQIENVTGFFTANIAFFFVPAGVSIGPNLGLVKEIILPIIAICFIGIIPVYAVTLYTARVIQKIQTKKQVR